ncbi:MAG: elongation factor Ts [Candidatus Nealsonbacteria bacterium CG_4_10_14_0_2_um_filter_35_20]|uniref:Elongation factor Ts n=2 Tax=Candidatus Nealsoniibacteriota TaxID=1817911 RepID=A0A2M7DAE2_9BACT|nr:MAG: elongation factor Ts [Candidatus Nealsonbacteria bacterium CG11_big_fil_rev_8_21_14_0_20_35_11]PIV45404.1 MAG: elongation factor Ts [Candidatus Nealsonbacteria bacterium CG02_land_8_20_14_3_00_34_20]PIW92670.1 MAG: elongation factor Ts [Candidatus Nealsonbacteria bacterium CG_4_8_14_3_um_filter_34_13]PIZ90066.1 MAG: elongation factor Ts [Candidatus Nealsonbacteria bacterium CG_4_10_14_0_2_um_filter_35_20]
MVTIDQIKQLREETNVSVTECKKVLQEAKGNIEEAKKILKGKSQSFAQKKVGREAKAGIIDSYVHSGKKIGVLLEIHCESDFVARSREFQKLSHELCLQITAMTPLFLEEEDIPEEFLNREKIFFETQARNLGKSQKIINKIVKGKLEKYKKETSLLSQTWIRDETKTIEDLINEYIAKLGENIFVKKFTRYEL